MLMNLFCSSEEQLSYFEIGENDEIEVVFGFLDEKIPHILNEKLIPRVVWECHVLGYFNLSMFNIFGLLFDSIQ